VGEKVSAKKSKQVCVALAASIWIRELMMRRGLGRSLLHRLNLMDGYIGLPEIVEREILMDLVRVRLKANEEIEKNYGKRDIH
jgi:hypothetical protein